MIWASGSAKIEAPSIRKGNGISSRPVAFLTLKLFKWLNTSICDSKEKEKTIYICPLLRIKSSYKT